jgi:hypothetical protein
MQFSPPSCQFTPLRSKYPPQHAVLKHHKSVFPLNVRDQIHTQTEPRAKLLV